jgi:hypothetical protein
VREVTTIVKIGSEIWSTEGMHSEEGGGAVELLGLGDGEDSRGEN